MRVTGDIAELRTLIKEYKQAGKKVSFVPTMGALHRGHLSLIRLAKQHSDVVVVSIYVNPKQFAPNEDFATYPSSLEQDINFCKEEGVSLVFTPNTEVMYHQELFFSLDIRELNTHLDGASRIGYFQGIALVVNKLFNIVEPDIAVFGQKDYQQYKVIEAMVREFNHGLNLLMAPIERDHDGLALSSRNAYLSEEERAKAPMLYQALQKAKGAIEQGMKNTTPLLEELQEELRLAGFQNDYFGVYSIDRLQPVKQIEENTDYVLAIAAYLGKARLIDNIILSK